MKILITGARGYIGSFLFEQLKIKYKVIGTSLHKDFKNNIIFMDIRNTSLVEKIFNEELPNIIIHSAAISNVSICSINENETFRTNTEGTLNIVKAANRIRAKVIFISSLASNNPLTIYGQSKQKAEKYIQTVEAGYEILQLSMTFGFSPNTTSRRPFNKILNNFKSGKVQDYDNSWKFYPTYIDDLLFIIQKLIEQPFLGRKIIVITEKKCTMYQLALDILRDNTIVHGLKIYENRIEDILDINLLTNFNFPIFKYDNMIKKIRKQWNFKELYI